MSELDVLRNVPLFAGLSQAQLEAVVRAVRPHCVAVDQAILSEGEQGDSMFILVKGSVEVSKRLGPLASVSENGAKEKVLVRLHAPQFLGEMGLLEGTERSATVTARSECNLLELTQSDFERLAEHDPALGYVVVRNIARVLSSRLRRTDHDMVKLTVALSLALGNR